VEGKQISIWKGLKIKKEEHLLQNVKNDRLGGFNFERPQRLEGREKEEIISKRGKMEYRRQQD